MRRTEWIHPKFLNVTERNNRSMCVWERKSIRATVDNTTYTVAIIFWRIKSSFKWSETQDGPTCWNYPSHIGRGDQFCGIKMEDKAIKQIQRKRYRTESEWSNSTVECQCCYSDVTLEEMIPCKKEGHLFCVDCIKGYTKTQVFVHASIWVLTKSLSFCIWVYVKCIAEKRYRVTVETRIWMFNGMYLEESTRSPTCVTQRITTNGRKLKKSMCK